MIVSTPNFVLSNTGNVNSPVIAYHNLVTIINLTASETAEDDYPVTNLANPTTNYGWVSSNANDQYLTVDDLEGDVDYIAVADHNFGTDGTVLSVEAYSELDSSAEPIWEEIAPEFITSKNSPLIIQLAKHPYIGIRLKMQPNSIAPSAAVLMVGLMMKVQRNLYVGHSPLTYARKLNVVNQRSEAGNFLGRIVLGETFETEVALMNLTPAWYRGTFDQFVRGVDETCFFFAWRPGDYPNEVGYCWLTGDVIPSNQLANGMMQVTFGIGGIA
jgi:hypothetical protein